ncbi:copper-binding protein [Oceanicola sp. 22II-s10i]|uniref:copper chaperone PCu(A)C n=1 Tax=Oceanicola sp. 22II-s10i TaxID=1317116 RepID=UPI000B682D8A|nr:copper chaperone PCu(A)C [Oceanicola sp. 22II-s10i]OWU85348.1 copper-binding protein [Oceanicola sp. 22II-s10i]
MTDTMFRRALTAAVFTLVPATLLAGDITVEDAYARTSGMMAQSGAAFMTIHNAGTEDDRLTGVASEAAARVELHTHIDAGNGVMQMRENEDGFEIPAGGTHALARGGDHVMFMGLTGPWAQGDTVTVTLTFEKAGEMTVEIPVDLERQPQAAGQMKHGHKVSN